MNRHKRAKKLKQILTKSFLKQEYLDKKLSSHKIAKNLKTSHTVVTKYLHKYNIQIRTKSENFKNRKYSKETLQRMSDSHKGLVPWNKGKINIYSKSTLNKIRQANIARNLKRANHPNWKGGKPKCIDCGKEVSTYNTKRCQKCYVEHNRAENHYNWQNGLTSLALRIRHCALYKKWRMQIFKRDNYTCQKCKKRGNRLEADHYPKTFASILHKRNIKSLNDAEKCHEFWDLNNGRTLCKTCHKIYGLHNRN